MPQKSLAKPLLLPALFLLFLALQSPTALASQNQETIKTELIQSQILLMKQEKLIIAQQQELQSLKIYVAALEQTLQQAESKLDLSTRELQTLREDLKKSSESIESANRKLEMLSQDMKKKTAVLKRQRNLWAIGAIYFGIGYLKSHS